MAIDSLIKRKSALGARRYITYRRYLPVPTGADESEDREQVLGDYIGISSDPPAPPAVNQLQNDQRFLCPRII